MESINTQPLQANRSYRIESIDLLRGLVMIIMALDHTRDFFSSSTIDPIDPSVTTPALFFTRWITHFCAPVFVFLSGMSIFLQSKRKTTGELSGFLLKRGLWLIFVEIVIMNFAITFDWKFSATVLLVIWAIGISMVIFSLIIRLPFNVILVLGLLIVFGHNLLDYYEASAKPPFNPLYSFLHRQNFLPLGGGFSIIIAYPFLPWTGLMMVGFCFAKWYSQSLNRKRLAIQTGCALIILFVVVRWWNGYGNPFPWTTQTSGALYTFLGFFNVEKYPPSMLYMCMTIGPALIFLGLAEGIKNGLTRFITVYGRVPFLYYVVHFYLLHIVAMFFYIGRGHDFKKGLIGDKDTFIKFVIPGEGYGLPAVYLVWICIVLALYPLCKWFSEYKKNHNQPWLSYL